MILKYQVPISIPFFFEKKHVKVSLFLLEKINIIQQISVFNIDEEQINIVAYILVWDIFANGCLYIHRWVYIKLQPSPHLILDRYNQVYSNLLISIFVKKYIL